MGIDVTKLTSFMVWDSAGSAGKENPLLVLTFFRGGKRDTFAMGLR